MKDLYQTITDRILLALENGVKPWHQPWAGNDHGRTSRPLRHNGEPYNGINILLLWSQAQNMGYASPYWMTFKQALEYGACVRKGEKGSMVVYASTYSKTEEVEDGTEEERNVPFLKAYTVFSADQIDGLPERFTARSIPMVDSPERDLAADAFFDAIPANICHGGSRAFYSVNDDYIQLPPFETFEDAAAYNSVKAHELAHWTRHASRLNREFGRQRWGDEGYATEELVAEMTAAFIAADLGFVASTLDSHASYVASWIKVLKNDKRAIVTATSLAGKAADFLAGFSEARQRDAAA